MSGRPHRNCLSAHLLMSGQVREDPQAQSGTKLLDMRHPPAQRPLHCPQASVGTSHIAARGDTNTMNITAYEFHRRNAVGAKLAAIVAAHPIEFDEKGCGLFIKIALPGASTLRAEYLPDEHALVIRAGERDECQAVVDMLKAMHDALLHISKDKYRADHGGWVPEFARHNFYDLSGGCAVHSAEMEQWNPSRLRDPALLDDNGSRLPENLTFTIPL